MDKIKDMDEYEFSEFVQQEGYHENISTTIEHNRISGATFLMLTLEELKELFPVIGDRVPMKKLLNDAKGVTGETCSSEKQAHSQEEVTVCDVQSFQDVARQCETSLSAIHASYGEEEGTSTVRFDLTSVKCNIIDCCCIVFRITTGISILLSRKKSSLHALLGMPSKLGL